MLIKANGDYPSKRDNQRQCIKRESSVEERMPNRVDYTSFKKEKYFKSSIESFPNLIRVIQNTKETLTELKKNHNDLIKKIKAHYDLIE